MEYKLQVFIKDNYDLSNTSIVDFFYKIEEKFDVTNREFNFNEYPSLEKYEEFKLNSNITFRISYNKDFENDFDIFTKNYNFIQQYKIIRLTEVNEEDQILISPTQLDELISSIDRLFFIRKNFAKLSKYFPDNLKEEYNSLVSSLSIAKYDLKNETFNLRMTSLEKEMNKINENLIEYAKAFGIDFNLNFNTSNIKVDKVYMQKLKPAFISLLYLFISIKSNSKDENLSNKSLNIFIDFEQNFNKLNIIISSNQIFSLYFDDEYFDLNKDFEENDKKLTIMKFKNIISKLNGKVYINDEKTIISSVKLKFMTLKSLIVKTDIGFVAIEQKAIKHIQQYHENNTFTVNNIKYLRFDNLDLAIINRQKNPKFAITVKIKKQNFIFLVENILYNEEVFVRPLENKSSIFIGDCLLKDKKRAYIINLKAYLKRFTND